ncbi:hypothetical protein SB763_33470, partial [Burkholderia sp. SIMBA_042]|uniref:hypothetical protein n=1 Tax=Burkholderia sp. SIMBA_042 TaxID=3085783 RepID=UPI00397DB71C
AFDMGRSMRATILGLGGEHYDLGTDGEIAFQPLARIDREGYRTWAAEWVEGEDARTAIATELHRQRGEQDRLAHAGRACDQRVAHVA